MIRGRVKRGQDNKGRGEIREREESGQGREGRVRDKREGGEMTG